MSFSAGFSAPEVLVAAHYAAYALKLPLCRRETAAVLQALCCASAGIVPAVFFAGIADAGSFYPVRGVELHCIDDARMCAANRRFAACAGPTNVLSFPNGRDAPGVLLLSTDTLRRECLLYGQDPTEHLLRLLAHGTAHLCGLDHGPAMDRLCAALEAAGAEALAV